MESPLQLATRFMNEAKRLFEFFSQINTYIGQVKGGDPPISSATIAILLIAINAGNAQTAGQVCDTFAERAIPKFDTIQARNVPHFCDIAPSLFPEVPRGTLEQIVDILRNDDPEFADTKDDVFAYVDCLLDIAIRRQIAMGKDSRVPREVLASAVKNIISMPPAYVSAVSVSS